MKAVLLVLWVFVGIAALPVWAGFEEGAAAFSRKEYVAAFREFQAAAQHGDARAQNGLGALYENGWGVSKDMKAATEWYSRAAAQGSAMAQCNIGSMYESGRSVAKDLAEAVRWYRMAADQGLGRAQKYLGYFYATGQGVPEDQKEAVRWYRLAADQGDAEAQYRLGLQFHQGKGVPKDITEARRWYQLAANQGNGDAKKWLLALAQVANIGPANSESGSDVTGSSIGDDVSPVKEDAAVADRSFFGIPLGELRDFYRLNYSACVRLQRCVGNRKDITGEWGYADDNIYYVVLAGEIVPSWLYTTKSVTAADNFGWIGRKNNQPFKTIPERWSRLHGVEFGAYKAEAIEAFSAKYGQPVQNQEIRTSSERRSGGGLGNPVTVDRLSERANIFVWQNAAVIAELACFSDNRCDGVIVTKDYWPEFSEQRKRNRGNL